LLTGLTVVDTTFKIGDTIETASSAVQT